MRADMPHTVGFGLAGLLGYKSTSDDLASQQ